MGAQAGTNRLNTQGLFSGNANNKLQVDSAGLGQLTVEQLAEGFQSKPGNQVLGLEGRAQLLGRLGQVLQEKKEFFGEDGRPGNMLGMFSLTLALSLLLPRPIPSTYNYLDHILSHPSTQASNMLIVPITVLWNVLMNGLAPIWPASRTAINGVPLGDAWPCHSMPQATPSLSGPSFTPFPNSTGQASGVAPWESILPFHKLTQWLTYSLMQPMQSIMKIHFAGQELLTGLPEYRNGGLFIDLGVLTLKNEDEERGLQHYSEHCQRSGIKPVEVAPMFDPGDDVIVEWRGVTVGFLDRLCSELNAVLRPELAGNELSLAQVLEAGSWKVSRILACNFFFSVFSIRCPPWLSFSVPLLTLLS